ncbi:unnamed protein product, partial [Echinostoma caproni]|uniref:Rho-GAP domain-containing protein n=1 Tax=Echinostoma caproni TaxID=27848 RepID=A0A183A658_9TREM
MLPSLSPDLDLVTEIRCQLEKLFEIFRVIHVCVLDPESNQCDDQQHPPECFRILRPPPAGWSLSLREFETENAAIADEEQRVGPAKFPPILSNSVQLTGAFTWPLSPLCIKSPPSEYVLLTPTDQWPRNLSAMATRLSNSSNGDVQIDPHLAAGLLKLWLREMADPLVPTELQPECLKAACEAELFESQSQSKPDSNLSNELVSNPIQNCCSLIRKIPPLERRSLLYLILLLQHLAKRENASRSLMDPRNLATVIAPNLMRSSSTNPRDLLENIRPQTLFVRLLISYLDVDAELQHLLATERTEEDDD